MQRESGDGKNMIVPDTVPMAEFCVRTDFPYTFYSSFPRDIFILKYTGVAFLCSIYKGRKPSNFLTFTRCDYS